MSWGMKPLWPLHKKKIANNGTYFYTTVTVDGKDLSMLFHCVEKKADYAGKATL